MAFWNVRLPTDYQYGSLFGAGFNTIVQATGSGHEHRITRWSHGKHRFRVGKELKTAAEIQSLKSFHLEMRGSLHSFRLKDSSDYTSNDDGKTAPANDQVLGSGNGSEKNWQLVKTYDQVGGDPYVRTITLPVAATVRCYLNGSETFAFTFSTTTGLVTFTTAPGAGVVISAGFEFDVPVRFEQSIDAWAKLSVSSFNRWAVDGGMDCIEVPDEVQWPERWFPGGSKNHGAITLDVGLSVSDGQWHYLTPASALNAFLPAPDWIPGGRRVFTVTVATGSAGTIQLRDDAGVAVGSAIAAGTTRDVGLLVSGGTATWKVLA